MTTLDQKIKKKPSMRTYLIELCAGGILFALIFSVIVFILLINNVLGGYLENDLEFALKETSGNLSVRTTLVEDMLLRMRKDETLIAALTGDGLDSPNEEQSETTDALAQVVDLYSDKNVVDSSIPFVDMVYLFDHTGTLNRSCYHDNLSSYQQIIDRNYLQMYDAFVESGEDVQIVPTDNYINIIYTLYDDWTDSLGTVIFAVNCEAVCSLMDKADDYENAFFVIFDKNGNPVMQDSDVSLTDAEEHYISSVRRTTTYRYNIGRAEYMVYTEFLSMGLRCAVGVPADQLSRLLYSAVLPYLLLTVALMLIIGVVLFFSIVQLTKPLTEVVSNLQHVANKRFDVKLPEYSTAEFSTVSETFNTMTDTIDHLITDVYEKRLIAMDSEIRVLQSQINPHFMYNVLCTIALKAKMDGNEEVCQMATNFAKLTQARLVHNGDDKIALDQELQYVRFYLELQKVRFEDKLQYNICVHDMSLLNCLVPRLCVEMIVENAVVHGIEPKDGPGKVDVEISPCEKGIVILIKDDGVGFELQNGFVALPLPQKQDSSGEHNHFALNNVYKLLNHFYGPDYGISILSQQTSGTVVKITIPKEEAERLYDKGDAR